MRYAEILVGWVARYLLVTAVMMSVIYAVARLTSRSSPDGRRVKTSRKAAAIIAFVTWAGLHVALATGEPGRAGAPTGYIVAALVVGGSLWYSAHREETSAAEPSVPAGKGAGGDPHGGPSQPT